MANAEYAVAGVKLDSPLLNAAGSINGSNPESLLREVDLLAGTGIGAITLGSFTIPRQEGNEARFGSPTYYHNSVEGKTYNSMGLPNIGLEEALALAPAVLSRSHDKGKPVIYSGSPTVSAESGSSVEQARKLVYELLQTGVDLVELNVSCPNVVTDGGGRKPIMGYDLESMAELVDVLASEVGEGQRIGVKLPPYVSDDEKLLIPDVAKILRARNVFSFLVTANTIPNQVARNKDGTPILTVPNGAGGMSGPATKDVGREQLQIWHEQMGDRLDIVSALGVDSGQEVQVRRSLGAVAAEGVTFLWESDDWGAKVSNMLHQYADAV
jgi:dihydroorotate dehydrogenase (NAD+) catalytic subunit